MKILLFPSSYYPILGGVQEVAYRLAKEFIQLGHKVTIITQRYPKNLDKKEILDNIPVYRLIFPYPCPFNFKLFNLFKYAFSFFRIPFAFLNLLFLLKREKPDLVLLHFVGVGTFYLLASKIFLPFKLIVTLHGDDVEGLPLRSGFHKWLLRKACSQADYVTACSNYLVNKVRSICPEINWKSAAIHNGIKLDSYSVNRPYKHYRQYIFAAGRFVHIKGFDILIQAFNSLVNKKYRVDLILAGQGIELPTYKKLAENLDLSWEGHSELSKETGSKIIYWNRANRDEMISLLAGSVMVTVPSRKDSFGLIVLEAMAAGAPVVASQVGGIPELLWGDCGILVPSDDRFALAKAMEKVLNNKELRESLSKRGRERSKKFSWRSAAHRYLDVL